MSVESDDYDGMDPASPEGGSENGGNSNGMGKDGKPETEEEKRKNFLERNRQGESCASLPSPTYNLCGRSRGRVRIRFGFDSLPSKKPRADFLSFVSSLSFPVSAALKCRQRKKAWLGQLQAKVEYLQGENEGLQQTIASLRDEVARLSGGGATAPGGAVYVNGTGQPQAPPMNGGAPQPAQSGRRGGGGY